MDISKLYKSRGAIRRVFTKTKNEIEDLVSNKEGKIDLVKIKALFEVIDSHFQSLLKEDSNIYEFLVNQETTDDDQLDKELDGQKDYSMAYHLVKKSVEQLLMEKEKCSDENSFVDVSSQQTARPNHLGLGLRLPNCSYKLPLIKFKEFGGELKDWLPFWSQFSKIDSDTTLDASDKMQYLVMATVPSSVAREVVESYPATAEMYPEVIKALKSRFGRDDLLTEYYIRELLKIIISNASASKKIGMSELYDKLQCHLRNLETLGVSAETCAPVLMPLVSSCLPEETLKLWERSGPKFSSMNIDGQSSTSKDMLVNLLNFLKREIEGEQKVKLAMSAFGLSNSNLKEKATKTSKFSQFSFISKANDISTAAGLCSSVKGEKLLNTGCIFCGSNHKAQDCTKAQTMSIAERKSIVNSKRACFCCLKTGHIASKCRNRPRCILCKKPHFVLMCELTNQCKLEDISRKESRLEPSSHIKPQNNETLANVGTCNVLMQTLRVNLRGPNGTCTVRALIDSASQRSYILSSTAIEIGYIPSKQENIQHSLFGGKSTGVICHNVYVAHLSSLDDSYLCNFETLDQVKICGNISPVVQGPWINELACQNIQLSDLGTSGPIEILIGADVAGKLWTGGHRVLECGLVSVETKLGWTLMGKLPEGHETKKNLAVLVTTMLTTEAKISDLWSLDSLGIVDPYEKESKHEIEAETQNHFLETVQVTDEGRYKVHLPWIENHPPLSDNYQLARKRLSSTLNKLKNDDLYDAYQAVFDDWLSEGIIEEVPVSEVNQPAHYLPHRHVLKPGSTTPVRPVFDASAHEYSCPSLNQCLEKGPNLIEKIPSVMARFRLKQVGVIGDIRKAFLQIVLNEKDRDYLRFLWTTKTGESKIFRHCRVVFGVTSSPFLLEASIKLHLEETLKKCQRKELNWPIDLVETLASSFYVDNCVCSLDNKEEAQRFVKVASEIMNERKFELRGWELTVDCESTPSTPLPKSNVLGLLWDRTLDTLEVNLTGLQTITAEKITKRAILSTAHRVFDPIGFTCCVTLVPKLLLQKTWKKGLSWDQEVDSETKEEFLGWLKDLHCLSQIKIPRWLTGTNLIKDLTLHMFSDASQTSYASVAFIRVELKGEVRVQLVAAKSRVAPVSKSSKRMTIPRLELLAASISARLFTSIVADFGLQNVKTYFWTDATTVLAWIGRQDSWNVFVNNRVSEIRRLTSKHEWKYVPGNKNPADLPSRGCTARKLLQSRWWEGPQWLSESSSHWPQLEVQYNEEDIQSERKKSVVSALSNISENGWYHGGCSSYKKTVRMIGWIYRFMKNARMNIERSNTDLSAGEYTFAENKLLLLIQKETFSGVTDPKLSSLLPFVDINGFIRVKTKVSNREDINDFCYPIVLPSSKHPIVFKLIMDVHRDSCHVGSQMIMSILRQRFWILGGRRTVKVVLNSCVTCKRHTSKKVESIPTPLPLDRVRSAKIFEIIGVDLAGPLYLKNSRETKKAWVCLFTCSVYRAVHLELLSSLSTDSFLMGLRRFISRRGRPSVIYSDHGTNFSGADNAFQKLDWNSIEQYSSVRKIHWKYSPPTGPWWGGWWERLVGILKKLLRRVLGNAHVTQEEMLTILCDCEAVINSRPLTYLSDDAMDLTPLTPSLFLQEVEEIGVPDLDLIEASDLNQRLKYRQKLKHNLLERFRTEYLGQLQLHANKNKPYELSVGEIVLIGSEGLKRLNWPLARVVDLIKGKDGNVRLVRLKTQKGELMRPVQRVFPLEIKSTEQDKEMEDHIRQTVNEDMKLHSKALSTGPRLTKRGRVVRTPQRLDL